MIIDLGIQNLDEVMGKAPVVLEFYASWCNPCTSFAPVLTQVSYSFPNLMMIKIDVDKHGSIANRFDIASIPSLVFLKDGVETDRSVGVLTEPVLTDLILKLTRD